MEKDIESRVKIHWADVIAEELKGRPHVISTGITPSGPIHIGNMREILTGDAILRALKDAGEQAKLIYIADDFDPLRKRYPFLPESYEEHVGKPLSRIPDPEGCCDNYADHFLIPFLESMKELGVEPEVFRAHECYEKGMYVDAVKEALKRRDEIAKILREVSGRELPDSWSPFHPVCPNCGRISTTEVTGFDEKRETVDMRCSCGEETTVSMREGKLSWRVDWPARWKIFGVTVEPFGKDHATAGGSYDTGVRISREIYGYEPPYPVIYEWIMLKGKGAMSSSKGVVIEIREMIRAIPEEVLRYMVMRVKPEKHIDFDPGLPVLSLVDEFEEARRNNTREYQLSDIGKKYPDVPFRHIVTAVQIASDLDGVMEVLRRGGYEDDREAIQRMVEKAKYWLERFAPPEVKFEVKKELPESAKNLPDDLKRALGVLSERFEEIEWEAERIHREIYSVAEELNIRAPKIFQAIYLSILDKKSGPRAGWFLMSLGRDFVVRRLQEASSS
ncbi:MAG: lysyl-tRNA synthetase, class [Archaeoglobi archaeon]|nr:lysine--tRNA ligase [Candidatus Mnemosynella bozhongmuii]MDK2781808.1 lysyl-tRNA synthetase, class [Archaeoglobi archaeon]